MALINCPECEREASNKAASCPYCGYPFSKVKIEPKEEIEPPRDFRTAPVREAAPKTRRSGKTLIFLSVAFFIIASWLLFQGIDKKDNYYSSERYSSLDENAYVVGDAYNYIINGTYFAGYCAISGAAYILSGICCVGGLIIKAGSETRWR